MYSEICIVISVITTEIYGVKVLVGKAKNTCSKSVLGE